ncbi:SIMPL domain-containing protein [Lutimaribacter marinistellae]|uniref:SIMPL domain-containing protein n=1 Tax=Lutimaribacter marinistellae TaxID=1820329 RepID=A0ABV7TKS0_9RHOB
MKTFVFLAAAILAPMMAWAEEQPRLITVNGEGSVEAAPDMATIVLGVTNEAEEAGAAMQATSEAVTRILGRMQEMGIAARDVQTRDLSLRPVWSDRRPVDQSEPRRITGFVASNRMFVRVRDLDRLGEIMDAVIRDGANDFNGLSFGLEESGPLVKEARAEAVQDATDKARQLAEAAGVTLGEVVTISEHGGGRPVARMAEMAMADSGGGVPVAGGEVSVQVNVSMVFAIGE